MLLSLLLACSSAPEAPAEPAPEAPAVEAIDFGDQPIGVEHGRVRAVPPSAPNSAAFMRLTNPSEHPRVLISARSDVSATVELHTHTQNDQGVMEMRQIERIEVPARGQVELKPGGLHVMFIGLEAPVEEGQTVNLTLVFEDGLELPLSLPVEKIQHGQH